jgi:hypothetical protein
MPSHCLPRKPPADAIEQKKLEHASIDNTITDRISAAQKTYDEAVKAIQARVVEPLSDAEGLAELERQRSIRSRFDAAKAESLRSKDLASEKF